MPKVLKLVVEAEFHQIHLRDAGHSTDLADAWTVKATEDRLAVADGVVGVGVANDGPVAVEVELAKARPKAALSSFDHATEASLELQSGRLLVVGCTEPIESAPALALEPGWWRARLMHRGISKPGGESIRLVLWPHARAESQVLKRFAPQAVEAPRSRARPKSAKLAAAAARRGELDEAVEVLTQLADQGDGAAAASLAEIHAYRGEWAAMLPRAEALLANPTAVYAGNVFTDLCRLLRRAARELGSPHIVAQAAARVADPRYLPMRDATLLKDVVLRSEQLAPAPTQPERDQYLRAVADSRKGKRFAGRPKELAIHEFNLASLFRIEEEILRLWQEHHAHLWFDSAVGVARWLARGGNGEQAWEVVKGKLASWQPVASSQVAPVVLLVDRTLAGLMTPERCRLVLATPRGDQAR